MRQLCEGDRLALAHAAPASHGWTCQRGGVRRLHEEGRLLNARDGLGRKVVFNFDLKLESAASSQVESALRPSRPPERLLATEPGWESETPASTAPL